MVACIYCGRELSGNYNAHWDCYVYGAQIAQMHRINDSAQACQKAMCKRALAEPLYGLTLGAICLGIGIGLCFLNLVKFQKTKKNSNFTPFTFLIYSGPRSLLQLHHWTHSSLLKHSWTSI